MNVNVDENSTLETFEKVPVVLPVSVISLSVQQEQPKSMGHHTLHYPNTLREAKLAVSL